LRALKGPERESEISPYLSAIRIGVEVDIEIGIAFERDSNTDTDPALAIDEAGPVW